MSRTLTGALPLPTVTDHPYRGKNPFLEPGGQQLLAKIRDGRALCYNYMMILSAVLILIVAFHWFSRIYTWRKLHQQISQSSAENEDCDTSEEQLLLPKASQNYSFWVRNMHKLDSFLMYQPEGDDAENYGIVIFIASYLLLTVFFSFYDTFDHPLILGFRLGLITVCNGVILYILGAKHTPLTWLTGWSYEQVNVLHRWCGALCVLAMIIHSGIFLTYFSFEYIFNNQWTTMGVVAGTCFFVIGVSSLKPIRIWAYELFYAVHLIGSIISILSIYFHYPTAKPYAFVMGLSFVYDRLVRLLHSYRLVKCEMAIYPGETVIIRIPQNTGVGLRRPYKYSVGQHIFLTVFSCGTFESHPFTIASNPDCSDTMDLIVRAREGFSRRLYEKCLDSPTYTCMWGLLHGPYGNTLKQSTGSDEERKKILLIAGGAGIAYTYPIYLKYKYAEIHPHIDVEFLWIIPWKDFCDWIGVDNGMRIWVSREQGRPDIPALVNEMVGDSENCDVYTCGPEALIRSIRNSISDMRYNGHMVEYHAERFGW